MFLTTLFVALTLVAPAPGAPPVRVLIETELGAIELELDAAKAPATAANFLRYVDARRYDGGRFHRTVTLGNQPQSPVKIEVIQGGVAPEHEKDDFAAIAIERTRDTGLRHKDGTLSMARDGPDTATSDIFICIGDQPELDFGGRRNPDGQGFAAFGRVVKGMDVVRKIQAARPRPDSSHRRFVSCAPAGCSRRAHYRRPRVRVHPADTSRSAPTQSADAVGCAGARWRRRSALRRSSRRGGQRAGEPSPGGCGRWRERHRPAGPARRTTAAAPRP